MPRLLEPKSGTEIPSSWVWTTLGEICIPPQYGWTTSASNEGKIKLLRTTDITSGIIDWSSVPFCETEPDDVDKYLLHDGDIVISRAGSIGYSILVNNPENSVFASYLIRFRPYSPVLDKYLSYFLNSPKYWESISEKSLGIAIPNVNASKLRQIAIPLAPFTEQHRIVAKIEELFTQLDASEAALKHAKANLERYRRSVLQAASSGQLVEQNPDDEPASHTIRSAWEYRKQPQPKLPFQTEDLPQLSDGWCWASLEQLTDGSRYAMKAGPFGSALKKEFYVPTGYKIYGQEQVIRGDPNYGDYYISRDLFEKLQSCEVKPGDVLVSLVGTIGKVLILPNNIEPGIINPRLVKFSFDYQIVDSRYFKYYLESQSARDYFSITSHGQTMDVLNLGILKGLPIPLPPLNEQKRIVMEVERSESLVESQNKAVEKSLSRIIRLRQSILEEAFSGRLVDQNPEDEPASILLQRIQAERAEREKQRAVKPKKERKKMTEEKKRKSLVDTLREAGTRLTPEDLFRRAGFDEESIDEFYEELRNELQIVEDSVVKKKGRIQQERPDNQVVYLIEVQS